MKTCKWQDGYRNCGSYAFNLYRDGIDQGEYCDVHYWQDQAKKATLAEREACAKICESEFVDGSVSTEDKVYNIALEHAAHAIRARK